MADRAAGRDSLQIQTGLERKVSSPVTPAKGNEVMDKINILKQLLNNEDSKVRNIQTAKDRMIRATPSHASGDSFEHLLTPVGRHPINSRPESRNEQTQ